MTESRKEGEEEESHVVGSRARPPAKQRLALESKSFKELIFSAHQVNARRHSIPTIKQNNEEHGLAQSQKDPSGCLCLQEWHDCYRQLDKAIEDNGNLPRVKHPWSATGWSRTGL